MNNALHYAVKCQADYIVSLLLAEGINYDQVNEIGHSPLSLSLQGTANPVLTEIASLIDPIWIKLMKQGADLNIVYPEKSHDDCKNGLKILKIQEGTDSKKNRDSEASRTSTEAKRDYRCTIMINYAQHNSLKMEHMIETFQTLIKYGARFEGVDSDGLTVLDHAIMKNNEALVTWLLANQRGLVINHRQPDGRTAIHICVKPLGFGSYENVKILRKLHNSGFDLNARDNTGKTPLDYAMEQDSKVMAKEICTLLATHVDLSLRLRRNSITPTIEWPEFTHDFTEDA